MNHTDIVDTLRAEGMKIAPGVGVTGATLFGIPLPDVVMYVTLVYTALSLLKLIHGAWKEHHDKDRSDR